MNLKVAHLISIQFGIFVGIVFCLVVYRFENSGPRPAGEKRGPVTERAADVDSLGQSEEQPGDLDDNSADADLAELAVEPPRTPLPNEYSPEAVERYRAEATRLYYEQIAPRRVATTTIAAAAPAYTETVEEPAVDQTSYVAPEPVAYVQPTQVIVYPQPVQFVVFSQRNRHADRCRPASATGNVAPNSHPRPDGQRMHSSASIRPPGFPGTARHRNGGAASCPATQGFASRGTR